MRRPGISAPWTLAKICIAWPLLADCELPSRHTLANNIFQPVEMHLGE
jgi:hypothetical protein